MTSKYFRICLDSGITVMVECKMIDRMNVHNSNSVLTLLVQMIQVSYKNELVYFRTRIPSTG